MVLIYLYLSSVAKLDLASSSLATLFSELQDLEKIDQDKLDDAHLIASELAFAPSSQLSMRVTVLEYVANIKDNTLPSFDSARHDTERPDAFYKVKFSKVSTSSTAFSPLPDKTFDPSESGGTLDWTTVSDPTLPLLGDTAHLMIIELERPYAINSFFLSESFTIKSQQLSLPRNDSEWTWNGP